LYALGVIIFGLVFIKKSNQTGFKKKPEPKLVGLSVQTNRFRFGYFKTKTSSNRPVRFGLAWFFSVWVRFGLVFLISDL
jgi:hypothetical protein